MTYNQASNQTDDNEGMWLVRMPGGGVRAVTLEQLDEAYQNDWITGDAEILEEGASEWRKLSEIIGGDEPAAPPPPVPAPVAQPSYPQPAPAVYGAQAQQAQRNQGYGYPGAQSVAPSMPAPAASRPPMSAQPSQYPYGPSVAPSAMKSTAPVAADINNFDLSLDGSPFQKKSKKGIFVAAALLVVGGVGVAVATSSESAPTPVAAAAQAPAIPLAAKPILPSEPEATEKPKASPEARLNEDTKRALADADKKRDKAMSEKKKAKGAARAVSSSRKRSGGERSVISKGGDKHDPLNGSL